MMQILVALLALLPAHAEGEKRMDVLLIGDSHSVGVFGQTLDELLRGVQGAVVRTYASCGMGEDAWYHGTHTKCGYLERVPDGQGVRSRSALKAPTPLLPKLLAAPVEEGYARLTIVELGS